MWGLRHYFKLLVGDAFMMSDEPIRTRTDTHAQRGEAERRLVLAGGRCQTEPRSRRTRSHTAAESLERARRS